MKFLAKKMPAFTRQDIIVWGVAALAALLFLILAVDGLLFFRIMGSRQSPRRPAASEKPALNAEEFDRVIRLLDEREQKFRELLIE